MGAMALQNVACRFAPSRIQARRQAMGTTVNIVAHGGGRHQELSKLSKCTSVPTFYDSTINISELCCNFAATLNNDAMLKPCKISDYICEYDPVWACAMPEGCPPTDVMVAENHAFYRLALQASCCSEDDFRSYAERCPSRNWGDMLPLAVGLSILDDERKARKNLKLPMFRQFKGIIALNLQPHDGVVKQTGCHQSHYTWWRTQAFEISNLKMLPT